MTSAMTLIHFQDESDQHKSIQSPPGFAPLAPSASSARLNLSRGTSRQLGAADEDRQQELRQKKAWNIAYSGAKSLPTNLLMMYMSGNSLQIFSILITVMMFWNPVKSLMNIDKAFAPIARTGTVNLLMPKLTFVAIALANMMIALYKCQQMGLLPTSESDWLAFMDGHKPIEIAHGEIFI